MTLQNRFLVSLVLVFTAIVGAAFSIISFQTTFVNEQMDTRLKRLGDVAESIVFESEKSLSNSQVLLDALWEGYIGVFESDGTLSTIKSPEFDRAIEPDVDLYTASVSPQTHRTRSGNATSIRTMTIALSDGRVALVGLVSTQAEDVIVQLKSTLFIAGLLISIFLGISAWWLYRLGLRPIKILTQEAEAIAAGDKTEGFLSGNNLNTEAAQLEKALNRAIAATQQSEVRMRRFLADASHELRTPLTSLRGYSDLFLSGGLTSTQQITDAMQRIHDESIRMSRLVGELLELNGLEGKPSTIKKPFFLLPLLEKLVSDVNAIEAGREVTINCHRSLIVVGDESLIFQALMNLVGNALRYTPSDAAIDISAVDNLGSVRIDVSDMGPGISSENIPRLFDRFFRVDQGRASNVGGAGLGLAIVAEIMRLHQGDFGVESTLGSGSNFWLSFPTS